MPSMHGVCILTQSQPLSGRLLQQYLQGWLLENLPAEGLRAAPRCPHLALGLCVLGETSR